jgi:hypothetical protein
MIICFDFTHGRRPNRTSPNQFTNKPKRYQIMKIIQTAFLPILGIPAILTRGFVSGTCVVLLSFTFGLAVPQDANADANDARKLLKAMNNYMVAQNAISFAYDSTLEVVTKDKQKLALESSGTVLLNRPDKARATITGGQSDIEMVFDSKTVTLIGKKKNIYAQKDINGNIDKLIDELRVKLDRPLPAADLLITNTYDELMRDVVDVKDLGSGIVGGVECDHLAFRKPEVDWQIWIAQGDRPYPCKYVITSKLVKGGPQYSIQIRDWKTGNEVAADDFSFKNATSAKKIDNKEVKEAMSDLPGNFVIRGVK